MPTLAEWALSTYGEQPEALSKVLFLLPTRRSCRLLREAFLQESKGVPLLLPRMQPVGDSGEDHFSPFMAEHSDILPAVTPLERQCWLAKMILQHHHAAALGLRSVEHAVQMAADLGRFFDECEEANLDIGMLESLAPLELAAHWQKSLGFLHIAVVEWPKLLRKIQKTDTLTRRNLMLEQLRLEWRAHPPEFPVIAAGILGEQPAVRELLRCISHLPEGRVILPGLDHSLSEEGFYACEATHPQYSIKTFLEALDCKRDEVDSLVPEIPELARMHVLREALLPAGNLQQWQNFKLEGDSFAHMHVAEVEDELEEAQVISMAMRRALETPGKTVYLVTQDRHLARHVVNHLKRFDIVADDSAGQSVLHSPAAVFFLHIVHFIAGGFSAVDFMNLLQHPFSHAGVKRVECLYFARLLDKEYLRRAPFGHGLSALLQHTAEDAPLYAFLLSLAEHLEPFSLLFAQPAAPLHEMMQRHRVLAEFLARDEEGRLPLWKGVAAESLRTLWEELESYSETIGVIEPRSYPAMLKSFFAQTQWRKPYGQHPRIRILTPQEAQLLQPDFAILGGLNEGSWPQNNQISPWLSRPMREKLGLPSTDVATGRQAHQFWMLAGSKELLLTRARKAAGAPTQPSRFLARLSALLNGQGASLPVAEEMAWLPLWNAHTVLLPTPRPKPNPPLSSRPKSFSVTQLEILLRNPYETYATQILILRPLDSLQAEPDIRYFGNLVHGMMKDFTDRWPTILPEYVESELEKLARLALTPWNAQPIAQAYWQPRIMAMVPWLAEVEREKRRTLKKVWGEIPAKWQYGDILLNTRIDRLEEHKDGTFTLIDYKTGGIPSDRDILDGRAPQLALGALIAQKGTSALPLQSITMRDLEYWLLATKKIKSISAIKKAPPVEELLKQTEQTLEALFAHYRAPAAEYEAQRNIKIRPKYGRTDHLERFDEWYGQ